MHVVQGVKYHTVTFWGSDNILYMYIQNHFKNVIWVEQQKCYFFLIKNAIYKKYISILLFIKTALYFLSFEIDVMILYSVNDSTVNDSILCKWFYCKWFYTLNDAMLCKWFYCKWFYTLLMILYFVGCDSVFCDMMDSSVGNI